MTQLVNNLNVRLKKPKRQTIDSHYNNKKLKSMRRKDSKKKTELNILKRISFQQNNSFIPSAGDQKTGVIGEAFIYQYLIGNLILAEW